MPNIQSYDDYIRSILGYPMQNHQNNYYDTYEANYRNEPNLNLEQYYPEIYKIIYPMIQKACALNTRGITEETIENMVDDIYSSIESDNVINVNINLQNPENRNISKTAASNSNLKKEKKKTVKKNEKKENRGEDRQFRNRNLRDLIKILLIRELLSNNNRPPYGRPPINPGPRPPMRMVNWGQT